MNVPLPRTHRITYALLSALAVFALSFAVVAPGSALADSNHKFSAEADARVEADNPNQNFGHASGLSADGNPEIESYLRFRVNGLDGAIERATLRVWATTGSGVLPTVALAANDWTEGGITWNNRPERLTKRKSYDGGTSPDRWVLFDVSSLLRGKEDGTYTLNLDNDSADRLSMSSREGGRAPELIIETGAGTITPQPTPRPTQNPEPTSPPSSGGGGSSSGNGTTWYVSPNGNNGDGRSWGNAWKELDRIRWGKIEPGDTIRIAKAIYRETLEVNANGTVDKPIGIMFEPGTKLFGGRSTPLPNCGERGYQYRSGAYRGIDLRDAQNIVIDGQEWGGVKIYGWQRGIELGNASRITLRNLEITDNGTAEQQSDGWRPAFHGITMGAAHNILLHQLDIHDNGADGVHAYGDIRDIALRQVWLHNDRGSSYNGCTHPDGLQINTGFSGTNIRFEQVVSGPNVYHTILSNNGGENWTFTDVLAFDPLTSTFACRGNCTGFTFNHVTSDAKDGRLNFEVSGSGHTISNSLVTNGHNKLPGSVRMDNNYQYHLDGDSVGPSRDPRYRNPDVGDYTPQADVNGAGSRITSASELP